MLSSWNNHKERKAVKGPSSLSFAKQPALLNLHCLVHSGELTLQHSGILRNFLHQAQKMLQKERMEKGCVWFFHLDFFSSIVMSFIRPPASLPSAKLSAANCSASCLFTCSALSLSCFSDLAMTAKSGSSPFAGCL